MPSNPVLRAFLSVLHIYTHTSLFLFLTQRVGYIVVRAACEQLGGNAMGSVAAESHGTALSVGAGIIKPRCDTLDYRSVKLANGLRVLLISDPETDKAAAALNVSSSSSSSCHGQCKRSSIAKHK